ncbi:MAG: DUF2280 domain-containing protein [Pyrinomonadaceae bacterium]|nr:DUF2280 domain-containing protein [Pyrinomonadaceae bacterium]
MAEHALEKEHQIFVVQRLAIFERPKTVQSQLKENFGLEVSIQSIYYYQPTNKKLSPDLRKIFNSTRKKFLKNVNDIPIANKAFRLQKLQNMLDRQEDNAHPNPKAMREILEQAAKESGDAFSNKIKHDVEANVSHTVVRVPPKLSPEEWLQQSKSSK